MYDVKVQENPLFGRPCHSSIQGNIINWVYSDGELSVFYTQTICMKTFKMKFSAMPAKSLAFKKRSEMNGWFIQQQIKEINSRYEKMVVASQPLIGSGSSDYIRNYAEEC